MALQISRKTLSPVLGPAGAAKAGATGAAGRSVRLQALVLIRWAAVAGQLFTVVIVRWGMGYDMPILPVLAVIFISALLNLAVSFRRSASARLGDHEAAVFLGFDTIQLSVLLYLTGGLHNPFALLLLAPVAVAATILSLNSTLAICLLTILATSVVAVVRKPLPWAGPEPELPVMYVGGIWVGLVLTTLLIAVYAWRVAEEARRMADALAATSAALAREQQVSALGALAAAAAHELGSPLGTVTLIGKELERELPPDSPLREDVALLNSQTARCRDILTRLTLQPTEDVSDAYRLVPVPALAEAAAAPHGEPGIEIVFQSGPAGEDAPRTAPVLSRSPEILQGLGNLIHNAVQFASRRVTVSTRWDRRAVSVEIADDGPGFATDILSELGEPYVSSRAGDGSHMGLGIFIARNLLARSGAELVFGNSELGGARVVVRWPNPTYKIS